MDATNVSELLDYWEKVRGRTRRVADCIPEDKLEWTWKAGKFSPGDILRHLAGIERWMFGENVQGKQSRYPGHGQELASGMAAVRKYLDDLHADAMGIFRGLTDADLTRKCETPGGSPISICKWLRLMAEHEIHHRGQLYLELSMLDVPTPPIYGLTSEQVRERSLRPSERE